MIGPGLMDSLVPNGRKIVNSKQIGPGGLLLVVFHLFAVPVLVLWVQLGGKVNN
jgi:hypothetical protein